MGRNAELARLAEPWSDEEIARFRLRWKLGTRARTALELCIATAERPNDPVQIRWAQVDEAVISVERRLSPVTLLFPISSGLSAALEVTLRRGEFILSRTDIRGLAPAEFARGFKDWVAAAGLPSDCTYRRLRKSCRLWADYHLNREGAPPHPSLDDDPNAVP